MRIAIPTAAGKLAMHFGHCEEFAVIDVDPEKKAVLTTEVLKAPEHEPGLFPRWLAARGVSTVIAGGMGGRAQSLFAAENIEVVVGAPAEEPAAVAMAYLDGNLKTGSNICDH